MKQVQVVIVATNLFTDDLHFESIEFDATVFVLANSRFVFIFIRSFICLFVVVSFYSVLPSNGNRRHSFVSCLSRFSLVFFFRIFRCV